MKLTGAISIPAAVVAVVAGTMLALTTKRLASQSGQPLQGGVQQNSSQAPSDIFAANTPAYQDQFSTTCSQQNTSPFAGMNPLVCHGIMAPADSAGRCSLAGMRLLKQVGGICYYCKVLNPPINGIIIPLDQVQQAGQGFQCGADQADPNCLAVCWRSFGSGPYVPPPDTQLIPLGQGAAGTGLRTILQSRED